MRWRRGRRSTNIEDRRGMRPSMRRGASIGGGGIIVALIVVFFLGADPAQIIGMLVGGGGGQMSAPAPSPQQKAAQDELADFVSVVVADTEDTWGPIFRSAVIAINRRSSCSITAWSTPPVEPALPPPGRFIARGITRSSSTSGS